MFAITVPDPRVSAHPHQKSPAGPGLAACRVMVMTMSRILVA